MSASYSLVALLIVFVGTHANEILFEKLGQTAQHTGYAHIMIELDLKPLVKTLDNFYQTLKAVVNDENLKIDDETERREQFRANQTLEKVGLIASLVRNPYINPIELDSDPTPYETAFKTYTDPSRRRRETLPEPYKSSSIGQSIFSKYQLLEIIRQAGKDEAVSSIITIKFPPGETTIEKIKTMFDKYDEYIVKKVNSNKGITKKKDFLSALLNDLRNSLEFMNEEISDFLRAVTLLTKNKFSPLIVSHEVLNQQYAKLTQRIRQNNFQPVTDNYNIVFNSPASALVSELNELYIVVHIPILQGNVMQVYKYLNVPLYVTPTTTLEIHSPYQYVAMDSTGTMAKVYGDGQLQACERFNNLFHCQTEDVIVKNLTNLCLYNLFHQRMGLVERTCEIRFDSIQHHAVRLSGSTFRLLNNRPVKLFVQCVNPSSSNVTNIEGITLLNLTQSCPTANTPQYLFVRNERILEHQNLLQLRFNKEASQWLRTLLSAIGDHTLDTIVRAFKLSTGEKITLYKVKETIDNLINDEYLNIKRYITDVLMCGALLIIFYLCVAVTRKSVHKCCDALYESHCSAPSMSELCCCKREHVRPITNSKSKSNSPSPPTSRRNRRKLRTAKSVADMEEELSKRLNLPV